MQLRRPFRARARTKGFTLLELMLVLSVGAMITLLTFQGMKRENEAVQARAVGDEMRIVGTAVNNYISARYTQITQLTTAPGTTDDPGPRTCAGSVCTITVTTLVNEGMLPNNYQNNNSFGSGYAIRLVVSGVAPNWKVDGLVTTTTPWTMGGVMRYDLLGQAMREAGPDSGMTRAVATQMDGYNGIWSETGATFNNISQLGLLGFRAGYGSSLYSAYLRRDGTLPMTGDLNMSDGTNHSIDNVGNVTGTGTLTMNQVYTNYANVNGNVDILGSESVGGNVGVSGNAAVAGTVSAGRVVVPGGNNLQVGNSYYYGDGVNSAVRQNGTFYVQNLSGTAAANLGAYDINAHNLVANDVFITSRGHWLSSMAPVYSSRGAYYVQDGTVIAKPYCNESSPGTNGTPMIVVSPADQSMGVKVNSITMYGAGYYVARAIDNGWAWTIQNETWNWQGNVQSGGGAIAQVFCSFT